MLYRPNFCCHCGEKIARPKWLPWTSRRFCEFCEIEQMQHDLLPKVGLIVMLLVGAAGAVSYFSDSGRTIENGQLEIRRSSLDEPSNARRSNPDRGVAEAKNTAYPDKQSPASSATKLQREAPPKSSTEAVYYCGAMTRKGTPCTRRLKTNGRCWQHVGQPPAESDAKQSLRR